MLAKRKSFDTDALAADVANLRDLCVGCKNCRGACYDLLQFLCLPIALLELGEAHT